MTAEGKVVLLRQTTAADEDCLLEPLALSAFLSALAEYLGYVDGDAVKYSPRDGH